MADPFAEACVFWYVALMPLWWVLGVIVPLGMAGAAFLFLRRPPRDPAIAVVSWLWIAVAFAQSASAAINYAFADAPTVSLLRVMFTLQNAFWAMLGMLIAIGGEARLASPRIVRATSVQALALLALAALSIGLAYVVDLPHLHVPSLLKLFVSQEEGAMPDYLTMRFFLMDELMGGKSLRLILFFPWPSALALVGAMTVLVCAFETSRAWKIGAMLGGGASIVFGYSRTIALCMAAALVVLAVARLSGRGKLVACGVTGLACNAALVLGFDPFEAADALSEGFTAIRPGSSLARNIVYDRTWKLILDSPAFGYGWGDHAPTARWVPIPIGSHSTFYGVLYLGGVFNFAVLCVAFAATVVLAAARLRDRPRQALTLLVILAIMSVIALADSFNYFVPSLVPVLIWMGGVLRAPIAARGRPFALRPMPRAATAYASAGGGAP